MDHPQAMSVSHSQRNRRHAIVIYWVTRRLLWNQLPKSSAFVARAIIIAGLREKSDADFVVWVYHVHEDKPICPFFRCPSLWVAHLSSSPSNNLKYSIIALSWKLWVTHNIQSWDCDKSSQGAYVVSSFGNYRGQGISGLLSVLPVTEGLQKSVIALVRLRENIMELRKCLSRQKPYLTGRRKQLESGD